MTDTKSPETPLAAALKAEFQRLLTEPLTVCQAVRLARFSVSAVKTLQSVATGVDGIVLQKKKPNWVVGTPEEELYDETQTPAYDAAPTFPNPVLAPGGLAENMGNSVVREALALLPAFMEKRRIKDLIDSISAAKAAGLEETVAELKAELSTLLKKKRLPIDAPSLSAPTDEPVAVGFACSDHDVACGA